MSMDVKVWGEFACFTMPEFKGERVSYPVITPSAARGILEAIYWEPEFEWRVKEIQILKEAGHFSFYRNEVNERTSYSKATKMIKNGDSSDFYAEDSRIQRHTLALRDVEYIIKADIAPRPHSDAKPAKYSSIFQRRLEKGQCFRQPYLGCREFTAFFEPPDGSEVPINVSKNLGRMLFDMQFNSKQNKAMPKFFNPVVKNGILKIPQELYDDKGVDKNYTATFS